MDGGRELMCVCMRWCRYVIAMLELLHVVLTFAPQPSCPLSILQLRKYDIPCSPAVRK